MIFLFDVCCLLGVVVDVCDGMGDGVGGVMCMWDEIVFVECVCVVVVDDGVCVW